VDSVSDPNSSQPAAGRRGSASPVAAVELNAPLSGVSVPVLPSRIPSLDGLRAVSILLVLAAHTITEDHGRGPLRYVQHLGNFGVRTFFVISGFLITTLLLKELSRTGRISLKGFYARRALRIFPAFYAYVGAIALLWALNVIHMHWRDVAHAVTYTMNYYQDRTWYLNHIWSLSVEEQFYLLWPTLLVFVRARTAFWACAVVVLVTPGVRAWMWSIEMPLTSFTRQFQAVADALATGCLLAAVYNRLGTFQGYQRFLRSPLFWLVPLAGFVVPGGLYVVEPALFYIVGQSVANLAIAICIERCVRWPGGALGAVLNSRPLVFIGVLSYSLYLWQEPFLNPYSNALITKLPYNLLLTFAAALASYYLVELPFLRLKGRGAHSEPARPGEPRVAGRTDEVVGRPVGTVSAAAVSQTV
jgi:peptidoglycan/LPS O-acetylase OafA/YrhL